MKKAKKIILLIIICLLVIPMAVYAVQDDFRLMLGDTEDDTEIKVGEEAQIKAWLIMFTEDVTIDANTTLSSQGYNLADLVRDEKTTDTTWESSDEAIATITSDGLIKGIAPGTVTITGTYDDEDRTDTLTITVVEDTPAPSNPQPVPVPNTAIGNEKIVYLLGFILIMAGNMFIFKTISKTE